MVDVREDDEWAAGHPAGAVHAALSASRAALSASRAALSDLPDGPLAFACRTGKRSMRGGAQAIRAGRSSVYSVTDGLEAWEAAGLPVALPDREDSVHNGDRAKAAVHED
ncbi:rhodanese-like domain-containing protein [Streptomyces sp. NPDC047017]|uniref:rhodanese-like domain-containing protein n=1 Tax=Streptomyces sp. NPDC047017 TaxID=3155024 RepID=UPI0033CB06FA